MSVELSNQVTAVQRIRLGEATAVINQFIRSMEGENGLYYEIVTVVPCIGAHLCESVAPDQDLDSIADKQMYDMVRRIRLIYKNNR